MKILVIGGGGREHALVWKLSRSPKISKIFIAPGNAGTALLGENIEAVTTDEIIGWLKRNPVDFVVIGPDGYLAEGLADKLQALDVPVFGPTRAAAEIEWSKSFAKQLMEEKNIPTAKFRIFNNPQKAKEYVSRQKFPIVIKANGLASGKGVVIAQDFKEAESALKQIMENKIFGEAGDSVIIEEYLEGKEISIHAFCDGENVSLFPASRDYKRVFDDDRGPNTGGMGAIAPVSWIEKDLLTEIKEKVVLPCVRGLREMGRPFIGVLYPGIMVTARGPKVIEFNARFGDPETQAYMRLLKTDLTDIILACINHKLDSLKIEWDDQSACCVVLVSGGYPQKYEEGKIVLGLKNIKDPDIEIFHAGTKKDKDKIITSGGRVMGITARGESLEKVLLRAYTSIKDISFDGMRFRSDIGKNRGN